MLRSGCLTPPAPRIESRYFVVWPLLAQSGRSNKQGIQDED
jgi:7,8-dihydro-6-hydroxymethylpterin-pyrophosphokinase